MFYSGPERNTYFKRPVKQVRGCKQKKNAPSPVTTEPAVDIGQDQETESKEPLAQQQGS